MKLRPTSISPLALAGDQAAAIQRWEALFLSLLRSPRGRLAAFARIAAKTRVPCKTIARRFYAYRLRGIAALIDRRLSRELRGGDSTFSPHDRQLLARSLQRHHSRAAGACALLRDWKAGRVKTPTAVNPATGAPYGWSLRNLLRHARLLNAPEPAGVVKVKPGAGSIAVRIGTFEIRIAVKPAGRRAAAPHAAAQERKPAAKGPR